MLYIAKLATGLTATALAVTTLAWSPASAADPTIPLDPVQLPGIEAMQNLSPVIQQVARSSGTFSSFAPLGVAAPSWSASAPVPMSFG